jgi:hypothetical protein
MRRRIAVLLALTLGLSLLVAGRKRDKDPVFGQIHAIVDSLANISGMTAEHPVPYDMISKRQLRRFLNKRIKKTLRPEDIRADEIALKMFGLVPQNFDLKKSTVDLLTEQAAAFYDYDEKKLFLLQGASLSEETTTLAHELAHALADQHYDLEKYMDEDPSDDDENLAHTAVVEGQASWLMLAYDLAAAGQNPVPTPDMLKSLEQSEGDDSGADFPVLKSSPLYIQQSLLFPYTEGTRFFDAVYRKLGKRAFADVFVHAPVSSSQILHPERYLAHEKPLVPKLPDVPAGGDREVSEGSMGEFDHRMLLWQYLGIDLANRLAPHLRGAQFRVTADDSGKHPVLEYVCLWDSEKNAAAYFDAYKKILKGKWKHCRPMTDSDTVFAGDGDTGYFLSHLTGERMLSIEGMAEPVTLASLRVRSTGRKRALHRA